MNRPHVASWPVVVLFAVTGVVAGDVTIAGHEIGTTRVSAAFNQTGALPQTPARSLAGAPLPRSAPSQARRARLGPRDGARNEDGILAMRRIAVQTGLYEIEIVTDAASLAEKLEVASGQPPLDPVALDADSTGQNQLNGPSALQARLRAADEVFRRRVVVGFDGAGVAPAIDYAVSGAMSATSSPVATITLRGTIPEGARRFTWIYSWTFATYSLTVRTADGGAQTTEWLEGGQSSAPVLLSLPTQQVKRIDIARRYLVLGFTHIVPKGLDHMLFVLGIFLLSRRMREVLLQVSAFTIAHSITLALSIYGLVSVSPRIVEPLIAVSIAYVAIENIFMSELKPWRVALVFAFGLLHGMGFAGALEELGLPRSEFVTALVTFNIGVEAGQLAVIGAAFLLVGWYCGGRIWYRRWVVVPASLSIACAAIYWTIERLSGMSL